MNVSIQSLSRIIDETNEENVLSLLLTFKCSAEPDAEKFLKNMAIRFEKSSISRTYLLVEEDIHTKSPISVKGFFTVAIKCLAVNEGHEIHDTIYSKMNVNQKVAQSYLLGQLAKADGAEKGIGRDMISHALNVFSKGKDMFGCRVARLDCKDKLIGYYESCGFALSGKNSTGTLNQMVAII